MLIQTVYVDTDANLCIEQRDADKKVADLSLYRDSRDLTIYNLRPCHFVVIAIKMLQFATRNLKTDQIHQIFVEAVPDERQRKSVTMLFTSLVNNPKEKS